MNGKSEKKQPSHKTLYAAVGITAVSVIGVAAVIAHIHNLPIDTTSPDESEITDDNVYVPDAEDPKPILSADSVSYNENTGNGKKYHSQENAPESVLKSEAENKTAVKKTYDAVNTPMSILDNDTKLYIYDNPDNDAAKSQGTAQVSVLSTHTDSSAVIEQPERKDIPAEQSETSKPKITDDKIAYSILGMVGNSGSGTSAAAKTSDTTDSHSTEPADTDIVHSIPEDSSSEGIAGVDVPADTVQTYVPGEDVSISVSDVSDPQTNAADDKGIADIASGELRQFIIHGNYNNLCVGQNIESIFSAQSGRSITLLFDDGYITIIDGNRRMPGVTFSSLDTAHAIKSATATVSFAYGTKRYSVNFKYSVVQWSADLYFTDENTPDQTGMRPDENLRLDLSRYYSLYKRMNPQFCGWRTKDGTELYTKECIMTEPDMKLYPCFAVAKPEMNGDIGRLTGMPDVDTTIFGTYAECKKLIIGADIQYINISGIAAAFPSLEEIEVESGNSVYSSYNGALYKGDTLICVPPNAASLEIKDGTAAIADNAFNGVGLEKVVIPDTVKKISGNAFTGGTIGEVEVPASVKAGNPSAFANAGANIGNVTETGEFAVYKEINGEKVLVKVYQNAPVDFVVEAGTAKIADGAFENCREIKTLTFADNALTEIGAGAFRNCVMLGDITLPENVVSIGDSAFEGCDMIGAVKLSGNSLVSIGSRAFAGCNSLSGFGTNTSTVDLRDITSIGSEAFMACPLITSAYLSYQITETPEGLFKDCINLNKISDWGAVDVIGVDTFRNTGFVAVALRTVSDIKAGAFADCDQLSSLLIGENVVNIDADFVQDDANIMLAFAGSTTSYNGESAADLVARNKIYKTVFSTLGNDASLRKYFATQSSNGTYKSGQTGGIYSYNEVNDTYTLIKVGPNLTDFTMIEKNVTVIMPNAFADCDNIQSIVFNRTISEIPARLLEGKKELTNVSFRHVQGITSNTDMKIGDYAFRDCTALRSISFNSAVTSVGVGVCENCTRLYNLEWGANAEKIPENAFRGCTSLSSISITTTSSAALREVGDSAFEGCKMLVRVNGFNTNRFRSVTKLGNRVFKDCAKIEDIMLPFTIQEIGDNCFEGCKNLMSVRIYCDSKTTPFTLGSCIFGSQQSLTDAQCLDVWTTDKEILATYRDAWQAQLDSDYGDGMTKTIVISSRLLDDDDGPVEINDESTGTKTDGEVELAETKPGNSDAQQDKPEKPDNISDTVLHIGIDGGAIDSSDAPYMPDAPDMSDISDLPDEPGVPDIPLNIPDAYTPELSDDEYTVPEEPSADLIPMLDDTDDTTEYVLL